MTGVLEATAEIDLTTLRDPAISARFTLEQPGLGAITADHLTGQLAYRDGLALLTGGHLQLTPPYPVSNYGPWPALPHLASQG
ncbi:MAG: hypothetical protein HC929_03560 [Leptolyngbyaceae cyanobacterium SM2_5_2]|nr:hypothetical protein [Leptolyngbyaceae cyanobacterium SM2_5_2]